VNVSDVEVQLLGDHSRVHDGPTQKQIDEAPDGGVAARFDELLPTLANLA